MIATLSVVCFCNIVVYMVIGTGRSTDVIVSLFQILCELGHTVELSNLFQSRFPAISPSWLNSEQFS